MIRKVSYPLEWISKGPESNLRGWYPLVEASQSLDKQILRPKGKWRRALLPHIRTWG